MLFILKLSNLRALRNRWAGQRGVMVLMHDSNGKNKQDSVNFGYAKVDSPIGERIFVATEVFRGE